MDDPEGWLIELGWQPEASKDATGEWWAALRSISSDLVIERYGRGQTAEAAVARAADRWRVEQIGTDNQRKPGERVCRDFG